MIGSSLSHYLAWVLSHPNGFHQQYPIPLTFQPSPFPVMMWINFHVNQYCWWKESGDHHLGCIKPCKAWEKLPTSTGDRRISSINSIHLCLPSLFPQTKAFCFARWNRALSRFVGSFCGTTGTAGSCLRWCLRRRPGLRFGRRRGRCFGDAWLDANVSLLAAGEVQLNHPGRTEAQGKIRKVWTYKFSSEGGFYVRNAKNNYIDL